jgi:predicted nucleic acid-binding protein
MWPSVWRRHLVDPPTQVQIRNRPMDLADAAILRVDERDHLRKIFTVDHRDFSVYRLHNRTRPILIP